MKLQIQRPLPNKCLPMNTRVHDGVTFLATFRGQASQRKATVNAPCQIQQSKIMRMILKIAQSIYEIYYTFSNISRILSHILIKYIYIYIPFIFSITTFLLHWLTHTLPRNKILFFLHPDMRRVIYLLQEFQKKKNKNRISSKSKIIFSHLTKPL